MTTKTNSKSQGQADNAVTADTAPVASRLNSKIGKVIALLQRKQGATLDELVTATGWQPHSARAALTGLRKKGHAIERSKHGDATSYRITKVA